MLTSSIDTPTRFTFTSNKTLKLEIEAIFRLLFVYADTTNKKHTHTIVKYIHSSLLSESKIIISRNRIGNIIYFRWILLIVYYRYLHLNICEIKVQFLLIQPLVFSIICTYKCIIGILCKCNIIYTFWNRLQKSV